MSEIRDKIQRTMRSHTSPFTTRESGGELRIEGYFAVFNSNYEIMDNYTESIAPGAFAETLSGDVRALINHDSTLVLGRTTAGTLELREDEHGLWGSILINPNDQDAVNLYNRVVRGDVDQCSFGFEILDEDVESSLNGSVHWTIKKVRLYEVSCCTFPAYEETSISARQHDIETIEKRRLDAWREEMRNKLGGKNHGTESPDAEAQNR